MIHSSVTVLKKIRVTEKATTLASTCNQYIFNVVPSATASQIKLAVQVAFNVDVVRVNTLNIKPKLKRNRYQRGGSLILTDRFKKAIVTLKNGQKK